EERNRLTEERTVLTEESIVLPAVRTAAIPLFSVLSRIFGSCLHAADDSPHSDIFFDFVVQAGHALADEIPQSKGTTTTIQHRKAEVDRGRLHGRNGRFEARL